MATTRHSQAPLPVYRANYRVVVLRNLRAEEPHQRVEAHCLELDLAGRGKNVNDALADLAETIGREFVEEWTNLNPSYSNTPDPLLIEAFEGKRKNLDPEFSDYSVLQRLTMKIEANLVRRSARTKARPRVVFEPMAA